MDFSHYQKVAKWEARHHRRTAMSDEDDFEQAAMIALLKRKPDNLGLAIAVARYAIIDEIRRSQKNRSKEVPVPELPERLHEIADMEDSLEQINALAKELRSLPTPTQTQVLQELSEGRTMSEVADNLNVAEATVKTHSDKARQKLGGRNVVHAVSIAILRHLIPGPRSRRRDDGGTEDQQKTEDG